MGNTVKMAVKYLLLVSMILGFSHAKVENITITGSSLSKDSNLLKSSLEASTKVTVEIYNGSWLENIVLPQTGIEEQSEITINTTATWSTYVNNKSYKTKLNDESKTFVYKDGYWEDREPTVILYGSALAPLSKSEDKLKEYINRYEEVVFSIYNGSWIGEVTLPEKGVKEHSRVVFNVSSFNSFKVKTSTKIKTLKNGDNETYIYENGKWRHRTPTLLLDTQASLSELSENADTLKEYFKTIRQVHLKLRNGVWTQNIQLPDGVEEGSELLVDTEATWGTNIISSEKSVYLHKESRKFVYTHNAWEYRIPKIMLWKKRLASIDNSAEGLRKYVDKAQEVVINLYNGSWARTIVLPENVKEYSRVTVRTIADWSTDVKFSNSVVKVHNQVFELIYLYGQWVEVDKAKQREYLNAKDIVNNISGDFEGMFQFAQTHTIYPNGNEAKGLPRLVSGRAALAIFIPKEASRNSSYELELSDVNGKVEKISMLAPKYQPKTAKKNDFVATAEMPDVIYHKRAWTAKIPAKFIYPNMKIEIVESKNGQTLNRAELGDIEVGAGGEVTIYNIRLGMLTPHRDLAKNPKVNDFEGSYALAKDYFNKVPVKKLTVANYAPMTLDKVVLANGKVYTEASEGNGGAQAGDMRGYVAKLLVSDGINNANYGVNSWITAESGNHFTSMHTIHRAKGKYQNGIVNHGYSGGNGIITLDGNTGNELSHELGHSYGLGHYPGGEKNYRHSKASGWGYDLFKNIFIPNFFWNTTTDDVPLFLGYRYNTDTMAGGSLNTNESRYTLHTGYSQMLIQKRLESRGVFDVTSPTGYSVWSNEKKKMVPKRGKDLRKALKYGVPVKTILAYYDPSGVKTSYIYPAFTSDYGNVFRAKYNNETCYAEVKFANSKTEKYGLISTINVNSNKMHINLDSSKNPTSVTIVCKVNNTNKVLATREIDNTPVKIEPHYIISSK